MAISDVRDSKFYWLTREKENAGYNAQIKKITINLLLYKTLTNQKGKGKNARNNSESYTLYLFYTY